jgi:hypothetical protein
MNEYNKNKKGDTLESVLLGLFILVCALFLISSILDSLNIKPELFQAAHCVENQATKNNFSGTDEEKWDMYSEDCIDMVTKY